MSSQGSSSGSNTRIRAEGPSNLDWASLPSDVLCLITTMLVTLTDYCHFGAVCRSWYRAAMYDRPNRMAVENSRLPLLLVPAYRELDEGRALFDPLKCIQYDTVLDVDYDSRYCGSSHGWVITMDLITSGFILINPFSERYIDVPELREPDDDDDCDSEDGVNEADDDEYIRNFEEFYIRKAVLSADPFFHQDHFAMMVIYGYHKTGLALYAAHTDSWTFIDTGPKDFVDMIYYKGKFCLVDSLSSVYVCSIADPVIVQVVGPPPLEKEDLCRNYLVESPEGDLLQVWRLFEEGDLMRIRRWTWRWFEDEGEENFVTKRFSIFKLVDQEGKAEQTWEVVESLGDVALFLGVSHGISVKAADYTGCLGNSIYFTMEFHKLRQNHWPYKSNVPVDMGIYCVNEDKIYPLYELDPEQKKLPPPIWIIPTLGGDTDGDAVDL